jgi:BlaI family transcriptional regulator, penicillinase repressor
MPSPQLSRLSRRERQVMDIIYRLGEASVNDVLEHLPDPPSYSAIRALLRVLEDKGHLSHEEQGAKYIYKPTLKIESVRSSALKNLLNTFFDDSPEQVVATLISEAKLSQGELEKLSKLIEQAKREGR